MAAQLSPAEASAVVEAALEACFGWSDPMAVALAVPAAPSGDVARIAKALRPVAAYPQKSTRSSTASPSRQAA